MSLDDRLREGLASLVADVDDPNASVDRVLASSQLRRRRRRTFAVAGGLLLALGGTTLALADDGDDTPPTDVAGVVITATSAPEPASAGPASTGATGASPTTTAAPAPTTTAAPAPTTTAPKSCSTTGMAAAPAAPAGTVPAAVADTRAKVRAAALACDFDALAALGAKNPAFVHDGDSPGLPVADLWRRFEATGPGFMRAVVGVLDLAPARRDSGLNAPGATFVWPPFAATEPAAPLVEADYAALDAIFGAGYRERFRTPLRVEYLGPNANTYLGEVYVEIATDGTFVALRRR